VDGQPRPDAQPSGHDRATREIPVLPPAHRGAQVLSMKSDEDEWRTWLNRRGLEVRGIKYPNVKRTGTQWCFCEIILLQII